MHGSVNEEFREMCYARRIVLFDLVPYKVVLGVAESCLREPAVYVSEATQVGMCPLYILPALRVFTFTNSVVHKSH